jgi:TRAP-type mannitol/chloroaromatic compound transport system substrate-binding protein
MGGGSEVMNELWRERNILGLTAGNTGVHMAGWFRKEIKSVEDLKGLKIRLAGLAGRVFAKVGGVPQLVPPSDVYPTLERGTLDAAKLSTPTDDERVGLFRVAPYYYYPGWNDPSATTHIFVNLQKWNDLPKSYRAALRSAADVSGDVMLTRYDSENPKALRRLVSQGAQLRALPVDVLDELGKAAQAVYGELSQESANFKRVYEHYAAFARDHYLNWQVGEIPSDAIALRQYRRTP